MLDMTAPASVMAYDDLDRRAARIMRKRRARARTVNIRSARLHKATLRFLAIAFA